MTSRRMNRLSYLAVLLAATLTGPSLFAVIWGPMPLPPLGTYREVAFFDCSSGSPVVTGYEWWDCLRHLHHQDNPSNYAWSWDEDCNTQEESNFTYWCKNSSGTWKQITQAEFESCAECPNP